MATYKSGQLYADAANTIPVSPKTKISTISDDSDVGLQTLLDGKAASSHNHSASNITSGTLAVARGGTGLTASPSMLTNLGSTSAANVLAASPRPGVTGTLPIANGGTGATTAAAALTALGAAAASHTHNYAGSSSAGGAATSANKLATTRYMDGVSFTGEANVTRYGTCGTAAATAAKTVAITAGTFSLITGARVTVKFTYANTVASPTLNVGSTGAKAIYWHGAALASTQYWQAGAVLDFVYNGSQWELVAVAKDNNTTYSVATTSANGLMSKTDKSNLDSLVGHVHAAGDITSGTLAVARGGTGVTSNPSMLVNLGSTSAASVFAASPRPGVTGTLPIARGGTGATTAAAALANLDSDAIGNSLSYLGLVAATATGTSGATVALSGSTMAQAPFTQMTTNCPDNSGSYDGFYQINSDGTLEVAGDGYYLISGSVYIKPSSVSSAGNSVAGCYIKSVNSSGSETEILSAIDRSYLASGSGSDVTVSTGLKLVNLAAGDKLKLYGRMNVGNGGTLYSGASSTYLTIVRLALG